MSRSWLAAVWLALSILSTSSCRKTEATTAKDFIKLYVAAHRAKDIDAILKMRAAPPGRQWLERSKISQAAKEEILAFDAMREREELEREKAKNDMWWRAWESTRYVSERDHDDHIHVDVKVSVAYSSVVLVKQDGVLRISRHPSAFD